MVLLSKTGAVEDSGTPVDKITGAVVEMIIVLFLKGAVLEGTTSDVLFSGAAVVRMTGVLGTGAAVVRITGAVPLDEGATVTVVFWNGGVVVRITVSGGAVPAVEITVTIGTGTSTSVTVVCSVLVLVDGSNVMFCVTVVRSRVCVTVVC